MLEIILIVGVALVVRKLIAARKPVVLMFSQGESASEETLCRNCVCALIRKNGKGEELTSCTYGGRLNPVECAVIECSGYQNRNAEYPAKIAGYIKPGSIVRDNVTIIRIASKTEAD
jgi:hypothetical protein